VYGVVVDCGCGVLVCYGVVWVVVFFVCYGLWVVV